MEMNSHSSQNSWRHSSRGIQAYLNEPSARPRLVRLCARLTHSHEAAEDLAQETLLEALRSADQLRDPNVAPAWVSGIARNVCLRWHRSRARESARRNMPLPASRSSLRPVAGSDPLETVPDTFNMDEALERTELVHLLDRAMDHLSAPVRDLLVERYVHDRSPAEIAARRGLTENAATVRLHRGKEALRRVLTTGALQTEAAAYGLVDADTLEGWQETRIWCPACGKSRLEARFMTKDAGTGQPSAPQFAVRCPGCRCLGSDFTLRHAAIDPTALLKDVKGFKPAMNRQTGWWMNHYRSAVAGQKVPCGYAASQPRRPRRPRQTRHLPCGTLAAACTSGVNLVTVSVACRRAAWRCTRRGAGVLEAPPTHGDGPAGKY
jgi:RNA polymerase sigma-70 factor (ECF subfamily)